MKLLSDTHLLLQGRSLRASVAPRCGPTRRLGLLIAQAQAEGITRLTADRAILLYPGPILVA